MKHKFLFLTAIFLSAPVFAHEEMDFDWSNMPQVNFEICEKYVNDPSLIHKIDDAQACEHFYHHNREEDEFFNKTIKLNYRVIEIDPEQTLTYTRTALLLWSKWRRWLKEPEIMTDGATKLDEAIQILKKGREANPEDANYFQDCGEVLEAPAAIYTKDLWPIVEEYFDLADQFAKSDAARVRARLSLGHAFRKQKKWREAFETFNDVLLLAPQNSVALRNADEARMNLE